MSALSTTPPAGRLPTLGLAGVVLLVATTVPAQPPSGEQDTSPAQTFGETVEVNLVNVEVWVTDRDGQPVSGLRADDFELREDGEAVEIRYFAEVGGATLIPAEGAAGPEAESRVAAYADPAHLILYFDQLNLQPVGRQRLIDDVRALLDSGRVPAERVLILRQDTDLFTEAPFGSSALELGAALDRIAASTVRGAQTAQDKLLTIDRLQRVWQEARENAGRAPALGGTNADDQACDLFSRRALPDVELYAREAVNRIAISVDHLTSVVSFVVALPGPKMLLYLSDALETNPGADLLGFVQAVCPGRAAINEFDAPEGLRQLFHALTQHANANRVTIYAMQPLGLRTLSLGSAQTGSFDFRALNRITGLVRENERDGLALLASETGGRAVFNRGNLQTALEGIARELQSYYSLAYEPRHGGDRAEHRIAVDVPGSRLQVRHRRGYRDKSPDQRMTENLLGALHLGLVANPLEARLGQGAIRAAGGKRYTIPLHVLVSPDRVAFLPGPEGEYARLTVKVMARNADDPAVAFRQQRYLVEKPGADGPELLDLTVDLEVPQGVNVIAVALRDEATQETSYVSTTLEIDGPVGSGR
ncbi:MAG TPA: VWA domain-containing protein [Thermoanaerobaculia bacterium]|nr:VWA domain-containing protein [Thermoanaerobaculia bacterium]